jgi:hypothetical protein
MAFGEDFVPITPVNFFQLNANCKRLPTATFPRLNARNHRPYLLPDTSSLCAEESFASVAMGWDIEGIEWLITIEAPFIRAYYPEVSRGDSIELFVDTRDVKTSGFNTRFCHHFFFFAEPIEGRQAGELTRFRTEDSHPLCDASALQVQAKLKGDVQNIHIFIPVQCLHGYDPEQFSRLGFSYRINRAEGFPQHFSVVGEDYQMEEQPSLWSSLRLVP